METLSFSFGNCQILRQIQSKSEANQEKSPQPISFYVLLHCLELFFLFSLNHLPNLSDFSFNEIRRNLNSLGHVENELGKWFKDRDKVLSHFNSYGERCKGCNKEAAVYYQKSEKFNRY